MTQHAYILCYISSAQNILMKKLSTRNTFADCTPQKDSEVEEALERNAVNES